MTNVTIQGTVYKTLVPNNTTYFINPTDLNGNILPKVTLAVDVTTTGTAIYLPEISTLENNWNLSINIIKTAGGNNTIQVLASGTDKIGGQPSASLSALGSNLVLTPVENGVWSNLQTY